MRSLSLRVYYVILAAITQLLPDIWFPVVLFYWLIKQLSISGAHSATTFVGNLLY